MDKIFITKPFHGETFSVWYIVKEIGDDFEVLHSARSYEQAMDKLETYLKAQAGISEG